MMCILIVSMQKRGQMGDKNVAFNKCLSQNQRYAECFNLAVGRNVLSGDMLCDVDKVLSAYRQDGNGVYEKRRDCVKAYGDQIICAIIGLETQSDIHQAMVVRSFIYDAYTYDLQLSRIRKQHKERKDLKGTEYIAGFGKNDQLIPVITICVYYGDESWDAPTALHQLINFENFPEADRDIIQQLVNDYQLIVLDVQHMEQEVLDRMQTDLRHLFHMIRYAVDKDAMRAYLEENHEEVSDIDEDIYHAIAVMTNTKPLDDVVQQCRNKGGGIDMCKAFEDMIAEGKAEERQSSIQKLILVLREIGTDENIILNKLILHYQLSKDEALAVMTPV